MKIQWNIDKETFLFYKWQIHSIWCAREETKRQQEWIGIHVARLKQREGNDQHEWMRLFWQSVSFPILRFISSTHALTILFTVAILFWSRHSIGASFISSFVQVFCFMFFFFFFNTHTFFFSYISIILNIPKILEYEGHIYLCRDIYMYIYILIKKRF